MNMCRLVKSRCSGACSRRNPARWLLLLIVTVSSLLPSYNANKGLRSAELKACKQKAKMGNALTAEVLLCAASSLVLLY